MPRRILGALVLLAVTSCGDGTADLPEATTVLADARAAMATVESAHFAMAVTGASILISGLEFVSAEGSYAAPDRSTAVLNMQVGDTTIELATIAVADQIWLTDPLTGAWQEVAPELGFNPAIVFGPEGWDSLLGEGLAGPQVTGQRDGGWVLMGAAAAARVEVLTGGQVTGQEVEIEMLVDKETARVREVIFTTEGADGPTDWRIGLGPYDEPVDIEPPPVG